MKVLIYGLNFAPELTGIGKYSGELAYWLAGEGHEVRVVTAPPYYPDWSINTNFKNAYRKEVSENLTIVRCPLYVPKKPNAVQRLLHLGSFSLSSLVPFLSLRSWRPDLIIQIVPTLLCSPQTMLLAKFSRAISIIHIQDYEIDAMLGLSIIRANKLKDFLFRVEGKILNQFSVVSTISEGMADRALNKGVEKRKIFIFPNWSEISRFENITKDTEFLRDQGIDPTKKIILYSGNMGEKQGLELVVEAARALRRHVKFHFLMVGEGLMKQKLKAFAKELALDNISFLPLVSDEKLPTLLASADCHLVIQKKGVADAVLPSKLTNIFAAGGNAVIAASPNTSLSKLCETFSGIAVQVEPESLEALVSGIRTALSMPIPNTVAKNYAKESLDKGIILERFMEHVRKIHFMRQ